MQLIQELISGTVRRNVFSRVELDLLLDLQMAAVRKSSRPELLRRYSRYIQRQMAMGASMPQRLSRFLEMEAGQVPGQPAGGVLDGLRRAS